MKMIKLNAKEVGKFFGFVGMFFIFSTILYFLLKILEKLLLNWNFFYVVLITLGVSIIGYSLNKLLR
jgi:hypothetical protein